MITVVRYVQVQPDQGVSLVPALQRAMAERTRQAEGCRSGLVLQDIWTPDRFILLSEWDDAEAFERSRPGWSVRPRYLPVVVSERTHRLRLLHHWEDPSKQVTATACILIWAPAATADDFQQFLLHDAEALLRAQPGLVRRNVYQGEDEATRFVDLVGWQSEMALAACYGGVGATLRAGVRRHGGQFEMFALASTIAQFQRPTASPEAEPPPAGPV